MNYLTGVYRIFYGLFRFRLRQKYKQLDTVIEMLAPIENQKMSILKKGLLITISIILLMSCNKNESNENFRQIKEKFHGKYEVISSNSLEPVDLNMDGISSANLLNENPEILNAGLELRISEDNGNLFEEAWPVEYISMGYPIVTRDFD